MMSINKRYMSSHSRSVAYAFLAICVPLLAHGSQPLPGPDLYQPALRSIIKKPSVALQWYMFEGANLFRVQAAWTDAFEEVFLDDMTPYHYYILTDLPMDGSRIFWRVRACVVSADNEEPTLERMECISRWSPPYSFFSGKPKDSDENENADKPGFIAYITDCVGLKTTAGAKIPWPDISLLLLAVALAGRLRAPRGRN